MRRVLFLDHTARMGGGEVALLNLAAGLAGSRYTPVVGLFEGGPLRGRLAAAGVETHVLPLGRGVVEARKDALGGRSLLRAGDAVAAAGFVRRLGRFVRGGGFDVVHCNSLKADVLGGLAGRLAGVPVVWHVRDRIADDYLPAGVARAFRLMARVVPDRVVANSAATLATVAPGASDPGRVIPSSVARVPDERAGGRPAGDGVVIHDGTHGGEPASAGDGKGRAGCGGGRVVGLVGRISPWKGQDVFLRAAAAVRRRFPEARFQVVGSAMFGEQEYEATVRRLCGELGLAGAVEFTGFRDDVADLIAGMDVLVHASTVPEPFGQVVIEGMAAGRPVVATRGGGVTEIVLDGETGLLVPMGDDAAMAAAVCDLLADPGRAAAMGAAGRERVLGHFTIGHTVAKVIALYDELLAGRGRRIGRCAGRRPAGGRGGVDER